MSLLSNSNPSIKLYREITRHVRLVLWLLVSSFGCVVSSSGRLVLSRLVVVFVSSSGCLLVVLSCGCLAFWLSSGCRTLSSSLVFLLPCLAWSLAFLFLCLVLFCLVWSSGLFGVFPFSVCLVFCLLACDRDRDRVKGGAY
jgi:hypothetical protein